MNWTPFDTPVFIGLYNYMELFTDARFYKALGNTFILMLMIIPVQLSLGMFIAVILSSQYMPFKNAFRLNKESLFTLPLGIKGLSTGFRNDYGAQILGLSVGTIPILVFFSFFSKNLISGLSAVAVKG